MGVRTEQGSAQREGLILFMREFLAGRGYMPTIADMSKATGMFRTSVIWHLEILRKEGRVSYVDGHLARSLKLRGRR